MIADNVCKGAALSPSFHSEKGALSLIQFILKRVRYLWYSYLWSDVPADISVKSELCNLKEIRKDSGI